jgi:hypothetical protein
MPSRTKNARYKKLRRYRDSLIFETNKLKAEVRNMKSRMREAYHAVRRNNLLRATALLDESSHRHGEMGELPKEQHVLNEALRELELVYNFLETERDFTQEIVEAIRKNDLLRTRALAEQHTEEALEHSRALTNWRHEYGYYASMDKLITKEMDGE